MNQLHQLRRFVEAVAMLALIAEALKPSHDGRTWFERSLDYYERRLVERRHDMIALDRWADDGGPCA